MDHSRHELGTHLVEVGVSEVEVTWVGTLGVDSLEERLARRVQSVLLQVIHLFQMVASGVHVGHMVWMHLYLQRLGVNVVVAEHSILNEVVLGRVGLRGRRSAVVD
jgi:hypothetical protein